MENISVVTVVDDNNYATRQAMLKAIPRMKTCKEVRLAKGLSSRGVWMRDVSVLDSRSVKAYLAGKGDVRATWWSLFSTLHRVMAKNNSLEWAMYDFHKMHHAITLGLMTFVIDVEKLHHSIVTLGFFEALSALSIEKINHK